MKFDKLAERQILKAQAEGQLDDLKGAGKPLSKKGGNTSTAAGFRIMAEAGVVPREIELKKAVEPVMAAYEYRRQILAALDRSRGSIRGADVLLLGAPFGKSDFANFPLQSPPDTFRALHNENIKVDQSAIFATTLYSLLKNAGLRVSGAWHDPRFALPDDFRQRLHDYDGVIWLEDDDRYREAELRQSTKLVVDVRDHYYEDSPSATTALARNNSIGTMYTGLVPIVYKAQRTLLQSLKESTGWAFLAICIVMILVLRSPSAGLVSMIPNVYEEFFFYTVLVDQEEGNHVDYVAAKVGSIGARSYEEAFGCAETFEIRGGEVPKAVPPAQ